MPQGSRGSGPWLAFLVGGLVIAVAIIAYFVYAGRQVGPDLGGDMDINLSVPQPPPLPEGPKLPHAPIPVPK